MWKKITGENGEDYIFYTNDSSLRRSGGSSTVFKGFTYKSLKENLPRGLDFNEFDNVIDRPIVSQKIYKAFVKSKGKEQTSISKSHILIYNLPLEFVAIKVLKSHLVKNMEVMKMWDIESSFLSSHLNVLNIFDKCDIRGQKLYRHIISEWIDGIPIDKFQFNSFDHFKQVFNQVLDGLNHIHERGFIHKDIKGNNILINPKNSSPKVIDFALCVGVNDYKIGAPYFGTPSYSSPEQLRQEELFVNNDIWSLGVIIYKILFKRKPFNSAKLQELEELQKRERHTLLSSNIPSERLNEAQRNFNALKSRIRDLTKELIGNTHPNYDNVSQINFNSQQTELTIELIKKCLRKEKLRNSDFPRYQNIAELRKDLNQEIESSSYKLYLIAIAVLLVLLVVIILFP